MCRKISYISRPDPERALREVPGTVYVTISHEGVEKSNLIYLIFHAHHHLFGIEIAVFQQAPKPLGQSGMRGSQKSDKATVRW